MTKLILSEIIDNCGMKPLVFNLSARMGRKQTRGGSRMATENELRTIENGPSELDFFVMGLARQQPLEFTVNGQMLKVIIMGIEAEDGSGKSWCFKGYIPSAGPFTGKRFEAWYDYRNHR
ncbi:MAG: hypothetical protein NT116_06555, partial [Candidatus Parcubacteria bacterium]|nr:hypothetical protein [Candidatus Parcubacteria bacterium]